MPIDVETAASVALEAGLTLPDVRALAVLADTEDQARSLAARFSPKPASPPDSAGAALLEEWTGGGVPKPPIEKRSTRPPARSPNS